MMWSNTSKVTNGHDFHDRTVARGEGAPQLTPAHPPASAESFHRPSPLRKQLIERTLIIRLGAELHLGDIAASEALAELQRLLDTPGNPRFLLNFEAVRYLSSEMLSVLALFCREVLGRGGRVLACGLDPLTRDILHLSRLEQVLDICSDEAEALGLLLR
ncbi:STAS domain-containing protein [Aquisphaera insulae]|uniref:STAS domain-containing protein n=1 Tax=Aquisphaera insulae TaxID=2712864 RepID=UPI0013E9C974|nr:STAS domain-containing protein [Aquisphaera insulae]